jgi:glycosyltransferase involved in cell wall biosynthesis
MLDLSRMRIAFVAGTLGQGGAERQLMYAATVLSACGAEVRVLSLTRGEFWEHHIRQLGISISWVGRRRSKLARLAHMVATLRRDRPHIVQSQHFYTNVYAVLAARALGLSALGTIRSNGQFELQANGPVMGTLCMRLPRLMAVNSRCAIRAAVKMGLPMRRLRLLPNVIDTNHFQPANRPPDGVVRLLAMGRLDSTKRMDRVIELVAALRQHGGAEVRAAIVGDGPEASRLKQLAVERGVAGAIDFKGMLSETAKAYQEADIFVLTSDVEGTPNVLLEAMASGLPVVAPRIGGVPDLVRDGETGFLTDPGDSESALSALRTLSAQPHLRRTLGDAARRRVERGHCLDQLPAFLAHVYTDALTLCG